MKGCVSMSDRLQKDCDNFVKLLEDMGYKLQFYNQIAGAKSVTFDILPRKSKFSWVQDWLGVNMFTHFQSHNSCLSMYVGGNIDDLYELGLEKASILFQVRKDLNKICLYFNGLNIPASYFLDASIMDYMQKSLAKVNRHVVFKKSY